VRALDLCAGAGGLSLGLQRAGWEVQGVELDPSACATHRGQVGPCDEADLWEYQPAGPVDLVAGGIPCQSHSIAGARHGTGDPRGQLYVPFLRIARDAGARVVVVENVRGLLSAPSPTHASAFEEIAAAVRASGFQHVAHRVLNAADFGTPQSRHRLFLVGFRDGDDAARFQWPSPTHAEHPTLWERPWITVRVALGLGGEAGGDVLDAPAATVAVGKGTAFAGRSYRRRLGASLLDALDRTAPCVSGTEWKSANAIGIEGGTANPRRCGDVLHPALTALRAAREGKSDPVRLTVAQLAALQAFPPGFEFAGNVTSQQRQVGNAVPPPLAEAIGRAVLDALEGRRAVLASTG